MTTRANLHRTENLIIYFSQIFPKEFNWRKKIAFSDWIILSTFRKTSIKIICMYRGRWSPFIWEIWIDNLRQHSRNWGREGGGKKAPFRTSFIIICRVQVMGVPTEINFLKWIQIFPVSFLNGMAGLVQVLPWSFGVWKFLTGSVTVLNKCVCARCSPSAHKTITLSYLRSPHWTQWIRFRRRGQFHRS